MAHDPCFVRCAEETEGERKAREASEAASRHAAAEQEEREKRERLERERAKGAALGLVQQTAADKKAKAVEEEAKKKLEVWLFSFGLPYCLATTTWLQF